MREEREYDETELWDSGKFFTLEDLLSEPEIKEAEPDKKTLSEKDRAALLREIHGELLTENERDELVRDCISRLSSKSVGSLTKKESEKQSIDADEVHRLYFDEHWNMSKIAKLYGYSTVSPISLIFRKNGWKPRQTIIREIDSDPEEVHRLYFEEGLTLRDVGEKLGYKSQSPIRRIFKEKGWKITERWRDLDSNEVRELYFEQELSLEQVAKAMGFSNPYPIVCIFQEQGWKTRFPRGRNVEIDPSEVYKLYYEEKMSREQIGAHFGYKSAGPISAIFREQGWKRRKSETVDMDIDTDRVRELYFEQELSLREVGRRIGKTSYALKKLFHKMEWTPRNKICNSIEEREERKRIAQERHREKVNELREEIFGDECEICGAEGKTIHRKDGKRHSQYFTQSLKGLRSINPDQWASVCKSCHLDVHALMRVKTFEWNSIKKFLREAS